MDRGSSPVDPPIGPALAALLDATPKAVRRAVEDRGGGEDFTADGKRSAKEETARLVSSLDTVARFLSDKPISSSNHTDPHNTHPVLDPLLERIVRPSRAAVLSHDEPSADRSVKKSHDESKKTALRIACWLLDGGGVGDPVACTMCEVLAVRCAPPTEKRTRLAACLALRHAAVNIENLQTAASTFIPNLLATVYEAELTRPPRSPPSRLAVAAVDASLAVTARQAAKALAHPVEGVTHLTSTLTSDFNASTNSMREICVIVRTWWCPEHRAPIVALNAVIDAFDVVARWTEKLRLENEGNPGVIKSDPGELERRRWLASAWRDWAPLIAVDGFFNLALKEEIPDSKASTLDSDSSDRNHVMLGPGPTRLGTWLGTCASCAADDSAGVKGAGDRLKHSLVSLSLCAAQLGLMDPERIAELMDENTHTRVPTNTRDAYTLLKAHASEALVPALRSTNSKNQELGAALLQTVLVPGGKNKKSWGPEQQSLLDGLLPLLEEAPELVTPGLGSLAAALLHVQPGGKGVEFVKGLCGSNQFAVRRIAVQTFGEVLSFLGAKNKKPENEDDSLDVRDLVRVLVPRVSDSVELNKAVCDTAVSAIQKAHAEQAVAAIVLMMGETGGDEKNKNSTSTETAMRVVLDGVKERSQKGKGAKVTVRCFMDALGDESVASGGLGEAGLAVVDPGASAAIECFARWCGAQKFTQDEWRAAAKQVCGVCLSDDDKRNVGTASATAYVRLAGELSPWIGTPPCSRVIFQSSLGAMRPVDETGDEEITLEANTHEVPSSENSLRLQFQNLAPALVLRALPIQAWDDWSEFELLDSVDGSTMDDRTSISAVLISKVLSSSSSSDELRRLAAELCGRLAPTNVFRESFVDAIENAILETRLGDARALLLATLSGLNSRGVYALGTDQATTGKLRASIVLLATLPSEESSNSESNLETQKTKMGGLETVSQMIRSELSEQRSGASGGLGAELGDGARVSDTLAGLVSAVVGNPDAPQWTRRAATRAGLTADSSGLGTIKNSESQITDASRLALADLLTSVVRRHVDGGDERAARAFADATFSRLAKHASGEDGSGTSTGTRAACFRICMVAFAVATTAMPESTSRVGSTHSASGPHSHSQEAATHTAARAACAVYAQALVHAASKSLSDASEHPSIRVAAAGLATALLAADDEVLRVLAESSSLDVLSAALRTAVEATDVPALVQTASGLLMAMGR